MRMTTRAAVVTVALLLAGRAAPSTRAGAGPPGYYEQVASLLDPSNAAPRIAAENIPDGSPQELCGIKVGMTATEVISQWGKPRRLGGATRDGASLRYGELVNSSNGGDPFRYNRFWLQFHDDKLRGIQVFHPKAPASEPVAVGIHQVPASVASGYWGAFRSLFTDKDPEIPITNSVIPIAKLKDGEIGGIRLGMTMTDVVGVLGKPICYCSFSTKRATLYYGRYSLGFRGDRLTGINVWTYEDHAGIRFDNGLTGKDSLPTFAKALGIPPPEVPEDGSPTLRCKYGTNLVYFCFDSRPDVTDTGAARGDAELSSISVHYHGPEEVFHEIEEKFTDAVASASELDRAKVCNLWMIHNLDVAIPELEKERGRPLTATQREKLKVALEARMRAVREEIETLE